MKKRVQSLDNIVSQKYKDLFEALHDAILILDADGYILEANPSALRLFGDDLFLEKGYSFQELICPKCYQEYLLKLVELKEKGFFQNYETKILTNAKSHLKYVEMNAVGLFDEQGKLVGSRNILRDVTQKAEQATKLRFNQDMNNALANISLDFINLKADDSIDPLINNALKVLGEIMDTARAYVFDYDPIAKTISNTYEWVQQDIEPQIDNLKDLPEESLSWWMDTLKRNDIINLPNLDAIPPEEQELRKLLEVQSILSIIVVPMTYAGELKGFLGFDAVRAERTWTDSDIFVLRMVTDIFISSRMRQLKDIAMRNLVDELKVANRSLSEFAHVVSHDLKTPLRAIHALVTWLAEDYQNIIDAGGKEKIDLIKGRVQKMEDLIDGILAYSSIENDSLRNEFIDLNVLVAETVELVSPPPNIHIRIAPNLPKILANKYRIVQLFQNILSNAIKYMDKPIGLVEVLYHTDENTATHHHFEIRDNGEGIDPKNYEKAFKIFQKLTSKIDSTGLGLAIVKRIVEIYNGKVWLNSTLGEGTSVHFTIKK